MTLNGRSGFLVLVGNCHLNFNFDVIYVVAVKVQIAYNNDKWETQQIIKKEVQNRKHNDINFYWKR